MHNFRKMAIWVEARELVKKIYVLTATFPLDERFGLISQVNRCAISVPSNIAEGSSRGSNKEFSHFLRIALGSLFELETQLLLACDLNLIKEEDNLLLFRNIISLQKMISNFIKKLN